MKKTATITFHWATNYGAVLQAYALQQILIKSGFDTEIIDYVPLRIKAIQFTASAKNRNFGELKKSRNIGKFRKRELKLSKKRYFNNKSLFKCADAYSAVICGSDQIWNPSFTLGAEGKPTLSYFLNFLNSNTKRIGYAVSFGTEKLPDEMKTKVYPEIEKFSAIGVREQSGKEILSDIYKNAEVVLDPTLLLEKDSYEELLHGKAFNKQKVFCYILHNNQRIAENVCEYVKKHYNESYSPKTAKPDFGIYEWLYNIKNSEIVVTNSFHGVVFSVIFHKRFIAVPVENSGMNDRIFTLLNNLNLSNRILADNEGEKIKEIINDKIDYAKVDKLLDEYRSKSKEFLLDALRNINNEN